RAIIPFTVSLSIRENTRKPTGLLTLSLFNWLGLSDPLTMNTLALPLKLYGEETHRRCTKIGYTLSYKNTPV
ncbi:MAG: hypothetical protein RSF67_09865, partial [Clostridia bacterium]